MLFSAWSLSPFFFKRELMKLFVVWFPSLFQKGKTFESCQGVCLERNIISFFCVTYLDQTLMTQLDAVEKDS